VEVDAMRLNLVHDLQILIDAFCEDCQLRGLSNESIRRYRSCLEQFAKQLVITDCDLEQVNKQVLKEYLKYLKQVRKIKHRTIEINFSAISSFYEYLVSEEHVNKNIILPFRKRYLKRYKDSYDHPEKRLLTVEEMIALVTSILDPRDKAIAVVFAKTGIRRGELLRIDIDDIEWRDYSITLKPARKRSNRIAFFDGECALVLRRWLRLRQKMKPQTNALLVSYATSNRLSRNGVYNAVVKYAKRLGFHNSQSKRLEDHFGPHCFRHWFTTWLIRNGMRREYVKELRGDRRSEAIDIYHHIDRNELRRIYLACIPKLGI
jgi:integrase/recombinase XerD